MDKMTLPLLKYPSFVGRKKLRDLTFCRFAWKNPWQIYQENQSNCTAIKKTDKPNYFQYTFQGSKNIANKKTPTNHVIEKSNLSSAS
jgi:hypothetical protein